MDMTKDRNGKDLTETEEIKKKWQEYALLLLLLSRFSRVWLCATPQTAAHQVPPSPRLSRQEHTLEPYKKHLTDLINHTGVVTHLELDILEYEVKWALSGKIPAELFQILKDDAIKVNMSAS